MQKTENLVVNEKNVAISNALYDRIAKACEVPGNDLAINAVIELMPEAGWDGNSLIPAQYAGKGKGDVVLHIEERCVDGKPALCAVFDSIQSVAGRCEEAALQALEDGTIKFPTTKISIPGVIERDVLQLSHRIHGKEAQESNLGETPFKDTEIGKKLFNPDPAKYLPALAQYNPTALSYGFWWSVDKIKGRAVRLPRVFTAELWGEIVSRTGTSSSRLCAFGIEGTDEIFTPDGKKEKTLSEQGLGNVAPNVKFERAVSAKWIRESVNISISSTFEINAPGLSKKAVVALRALAVCQALHFHALRKSYFLRSRCRLVPSAPVVYKWLTRDGTNDVVPSEPATLKQLHETALAKVAEAFPEFDVNKTLVLTPNKWLKKIMMENFVVNEDGSVSNKTHEKKSKKGKKAEDAEKEVE